MEADQAEWRPEVFVAVRIHHIVTGHDIDPAAVSEAIRISEERLLLGRGHAQAHGDDHHDV